jgi:hypothetical protein
MTEMVIIEDSKFNMFWECSNCKSLHKATVKFEKSKTCPTCKEVITSWHDGENDD